MLEEKKKKKNLSFSCIILDYILHTQRCELKFLKIFDLNPLEQILINERCLIVIIVFFLNKTKILRLINFFISQADKLCWTLCHNNNNNNKKVYFRRLLLAYLFNSYLFMYLHILSCKIYTRKLRALFKKNFFFYFGRLKLNSRLIAKLCVVVFFYFEQRQNKKILFIVFRF